LALRKAVLDLIILKESAFTELPATASGVDVCVGSA
jgi:hypothetical protein